MVTYRTDITVPIMTPTNTVHQDVPSPSAVQHAYSAADEDFVTSSILSNPSSAQHLASRRPVDLESIRAEAQALIDAQKFNTRKAFKAYLDEEIARLTHAAVERARRRQAALDANRTVDEEVKKLEGRYETERRALENRLGK
jgi:hypothetical protein